MRPWSFRAPPHMPLGDPWSFWLLPDAPLFLLVVAPRTLGPSGRRNPKPISALAARPQGKPPLNQAAVVTDKEQLIV